MDLIMIDSTTYLFSSFIDNPDYFFQGYCFIDNDYVYGLGGAVGYLQDTGRKIEIGEDGCYVVVNRDRDDFIFGSDHSGYKKILYFKDEVTGEWAVSNSMNLLVEHLRNNSIEVTPNLSLIKLMSQIETSVQQLVSFNTIANEIKILPLNTFLKIGRQSLIISKINKPITDEQSYEELIVSFAEIWASRFATIMLSDKLYITQAITGGLDSRSVFALSNLAKNSLNGHINSRYKLVCGLTKGETIDLDVAKKISEKYEYKLNDQEVSFPKPNKININQKYKCWKDICLGLYRPIYFPDRAVDPITISIGGGGGENNRPSYGNYMKPNSFEGLIKNLCRRVVAPELKVQITNDLRNTLKKLEFINGKKGLDPLILHYKNFRNRFHAGLFPQYKVTFTPLSSLYLDKIATHKNLDKINSSQVLYDLIGMVEGLLEIPFDYSHKDPTSDNILSLVCLKKPLNIKPGKSFIGTDECVVDINAEPFIEAISPLTLLEEDFNKARAKSIVKSIWSEDFILNAQDILNDAIKNGRFKYASDGTPISAVIATGLFE